MGKVIKKLRKNKESSRTKLLQAGLEVFSRHGLHGATTKMIAKAAQVNEALIMRHFVTKEGLFLAVLREKRASAEKLELHFPGTFEGDLLVYAEARLNCDWESCDFMKMILGHFFADDKIAQKVRRILLEYEFAQQLLPRLKHYQSLGQVSNKYKLMDLGMLIDKQIFVTFLMHALLLQTGLREAHAQLQNSLKIFVRGLSTGKLGSTGSSGRYT